MSEPVVYLAFSNKATREDDVLTMASCANCRNKTFLLVVPASGYNMVRCAACGQEIGRMGWAPE